MMTSSQVRLAFTHGIGRNRGGRHEHRSPTSRASVPLRAGYGSRPAWARRPLSGVAGGARRSLRGWQVDVRGTMTLVMERRTRGALMARGTSRTLTRTRWTLAAVVILAVAAAALPAAAARRARPVRRCATSSAVRRVRTSQERWRSGRTTATATWTSTAGTSAPARTTPSAPTRQQQDNPSVTTLGHDLGQGPLHRRLGGQAQSLRRRRHRHLRPRHHRQSNFVVARNAYVK